MFLRVNQNNNDDKWYALNLFPIFYALVNTAVNKLVINIDENHPLISENMNRTPQMTGLSTLPSLFVKYHQVPLMLHIQISCILNYGVYCQDYNTSALKEIPEEQKDNWHRSRLTRKDRSRSSMENTCCYRSTK